MATISTNQFKGGVKIMIDDQPYTILENEFVKPGKGSAFNRIRIRNLLNGKTLDKTVKSGVETFESADVNDVEMQYLYADDEFWHFMDPSTFEQISADAKVVADAKLWLKEQDVCTVTLWNGVPIAVAPPNFVILTIAETDPGLRGDTVSGGTKPAKLETGAVVQVPLFIEQGEAIRIDTREGGKYMARAKEE